MDGMNCGFGEGSACRVSGSVRAVKSRRLDSAKTLKGCFFVFFIKQSLYSF